MLFNSISFALFLPIVFLVYWWLRGKRRFSQNIWLLLASYYFYGSWDWRFLGLLAFTSLVDFLVGLRIQRAPRRSQAKAWMACSIVINLAVLGFFKYFNFFTESLDQLANSVGISLSTTTLQIVLPVGISFYTFQSMSYAIDVYRGNYKATRDPIAFFTYVSFFPQLVAGPIERASHLLPQFLKNRSFDLEQAKSGLRLMLWGFFKKVVVADGVAVIVDRAFSLPEQFGGISILVGAALFMVQIYCDFSGYSDIAIGVARLFGFNLMTNFMTPLFSSSIWEFWSRWHISLSTWFRDYVFIPLGGSRVGKGRWVVNVLVTFGLSGLWHGHGLRWGFWGLTQGAGYLADSGLRSARVRLPTLFAALFVFLFVSVTWIFFRAESWTDAWLLTNNLFRLGDTNLAALFPDRQSLMVIPSLVILLLIDSFIAKDDFSKVMSSRRVGLRWAIYYGLILWIVAFGAFELAKPFIYFQF